ncbi:MAG: PilZ domain-containing protein [Acidobacteriota bacterium]|nr:PilZ domain-containing protein [Acidobacteriota bacterium]
MIDERRIYQRLTLVEPLDAWFGDFGVRLIDVSVSGALVESIEREDIPMDARALLRFYWRGEQVEVLSEIARTTATRCGLRFLEENETLCALIAGSAQEMLRALEANARGDRDGNFVGDETLTSAWRRPASGFVCWMLTTTGWSSTPCTKGEQPANGFTIAAAEPDEQIELLCRTYENGDTEARRLTRMLAELSVAAAM